MASLAGNLWDYNLAKIVVLDVTDDYRLMGAPLPTHCYPVLAELWVPSMSLAESLPRMNLVDGYLYDWHEGPDDEVGAWFVGVVDQALLANAMSDKRHA